MNAQQFLEHWKQGEEAEQKALDIENLRVTIKVLERQRRPQELFSARRILHKMKSKTSVVTMPNNALTKPHEIQPQEEL